MDELEAAAADSAAALMRPHKAFRPPPGAICANCGAPLAGPYCHECGQNADLHKEGILLLVAEAVGDFFHFDGRLARTAPDLFLRPGRLVRDYMEGRIARHVPPFRTFLITLLIFMFAAEHALHVEGVRNEEQKAARLERLKTPAGRAVEAGRLRLEAQNDWVEARREAANDHAEALRDPDEDKAKAEQTYAKDLADADAARTTALAEADDVAAGRITADGASATAAARRARPHKQSWLGEHLRRALANREYFLMLLFDMGHRVAALLLPIVGFSLALAYRRTKTLFIYDHMLTAMNVLSFAFLVTTVAILTPAPLGWWLLAAAAIWQPINLYQILRGAYGSSVLGAVLKTAAIWLTTAAASLVLLAALLMVTLSRV